MCSFVRIAPQLLNFANFIDQPTTARNEQVRRWLLLLQPGV
jgi:hypothetical protein